MALAIFRGEHRELFDLLTALGADWDRHNNYWRIDADSPNAGKVRRLVDGIVTREESDGYATIRQQAEQERQRAEHDRRMIEHDLEYPFLVDIHHDHTNVRYVISVEGHSGRSYSEIMDRDEQDAFDTYRLARYVADRLIARLKKRGRPAQLVD